MNDRNDRAEHDTTARAAAELREARHPAERFAALLLAVAQRDLDLCRASSRADLVGQSDVTDPDIAYAAWLTRMTAHEEWARQTARRSIVTNDEWRREHGPQTADEAFAIRRARAAITSMLGDNATAARAAREDVLTAWPLDDDLAAGVLPDGGNNPC